MRSFNYGPLAVEDVVKIYDKVLVEFNYTNAAAAVVYVMGGTKSDPDTMTELTTIDGILFTRFELSGNGVKRVSIAGLTPGTYLSTKLESGSADTLSVTIQTGGQ